MSTDRELLEMAAKAAGFLTAWTKPDYDIEIDDDGVYCYGMGKSLSWNPLRDDGDALRLAAKLRIDLKFSGDYVYALAQDEKFMREHKTFTCLPIEEVTRRAIVHAAAAVGRNMQ